jgi:hypothetical protein
MPVILPTWEAEIGRIMVQRQSRKIVRPPSQWKKLGIVVQDCHPSYCGKKHKYEESVKAGLGKNQDPIKNNHSKKGWRYDSSDRAPA